METDYNMKFNKKALVITYHLKNCTRVGGFHYFIKYLIDAGYDVDWFTTPVSITWLYRKNDKENKKNFIDLVKGIKYKEGVSSVYHFTVPLWIPAKLAQKFGMKLGDEYWPKWEKIRRKLKDTYDIILVEGVGCQYAEQLRKEFPSARILYRPSDILSMLSNVKNPDEYERKMIEISDLTLCVDETCMSYYRNLVGNNAILSIQRNPLTVRKNIEDLKKYRPSIKEEKTVVYVGISCIDIKIIEYAAQKNKNVKFYIIGPFKNLSHDNVIYTGSLKKNEYEEFLKNASVGINPLNPDMINTDLGIAVGYTRKIINYMRYLMPIVATCSKNYLDIHGFYCVNSKEEFSDTIKKCLEYSFEDRESLREGYLKVMNVFEEEKAYESFIKYVKG